MVTMEMFSVPFPVTCEILRTDKPVEEMDVDSTYLLSLLSDPSLFFGIVSHGLS